MEGVKTIAYEICEQLGGAPDVVYVPVGGGGLLSATWKGFVEWHAAGAIDRLPKIVAVQPEGCDGITQAWREDRAVTPIAGCGSTISGLQLTAPPRRRPCPARAAQIRRLGHLGARRGHLRGAGRAGWPRGHLCRAGRRDHMGGHPRRHGRRAAARRRARGQPLTGIGFKDANAVQRMVEDRPVQPITAEEILGIAR